MMVSECISADTMGGICAEESFSGVSESCVSQTRESDNSNYKLLQAVLYPDKTENYSTFTILLSLLPQQLKRVIK